jgi:hypothetical protein
MAKLGDLWTEFRAGKPIRSVSADVLYVRFSKDDPHYGGDCFYDENECYDIHFGVETHWMDADDWELVPEPVRVADYLVPTVSQLYIHDSGIYPTYYRTKFPIGQQPEGAVMVPGSEKEVSE